MYFLHQDNNINRGSPSNLLRPPNRIDDLPSWCLHPLISIFSFITPAEFEIESAGIQIDSFSDRSYLPVFRHLHTQRILLFSGKI